MNQNGGPQGPSQAPELITLSITLNPATKKVAISIPKDLGQAYLLARQLLDAIVNLALNPEPERKVKTLDELGVHPGRRLS